MKTETSPHPIIGYREWWWDHERGRLTSPYYRRIPWEAGTTIASCLFRHEAPDPGCRCGLYADYRPPPFVADDVFDGVRRRSAEAASVTARRALGIPFDSSALPTDAASDGHDCGPMLGPVYGAIALEGRVCVHASGLRGARARIVVLAYAPRERAPIAEVAALYGAEAVPYGELRRAALEFGIELA